MRGAEKRAAWIATATALVVVAAFVAGKAARDSILLSNFDVESLPVFIAISAVVSIPIVLLAGRLMARLGPGRLMPALNLISAGFMVLEWFLLSRYPRPTAVAIFFHLSTSGAILVSGFWSIINERFDVQTAKRHIGRIGMGATLGGVLGGVIAQGTAAYLEPDQILLLLAGMQLICAATMYVVRGARAPTIEIPEFAFSVVTRSRLLKNLAVVVVLGAIAAGILDYVFKADIVGQTTSKAELLRTLAIYYTVTSVLTAVVQAVICGPLIARLGVPRSVATLPLAVTAVSIVALAVPAAFAATIARATESITRSSIYRAGYELLYAPLPEADKRPTKIMLDVGAERIGDLLGAQVVGLFVYSMVAPRTALLIATIAIAAVGLAFAARLRAAYTSALEATLIAVGPEIAAGPEVTATWPIGAPMIGQDGDRSPLSLRILDRSTRRRPAAVPPTRADVDQVPLTIRELSSRDPARIKRALAANPLPPEAAAFVIGLVARDDVGREALAALRLIATRCTGTLVDALLDQTREIVIRRRLPDVLFDGEPSLAAWGLWHGLVDPSFEVRYRCGAALARLAMANQLGGVTSELVFETVRKELDPAAWKYQRVVDDEIASAVDHDAANFQHSGSSLEHVFTVLGLVLPAEPLRIALHAVQADDAALRATALEYLESILPTDVRIQLWPLLENDGATEPTATPSDAPPVRPSRTKDELVTALNKAYPTIRARILEKHPASSS